MSLDETVDPTSTAEAERMAGPSVDTGTRPKIFTSPGELTTVTPIERLRRAVGVVTIAGWTTVGLALGSWSLGYWFGWHEFMYITAVAVCCLVVATLFLFGSTSLRVEVEVNPQRVIVGRRAAGQLVVTNPTGHRSLPSRLELVVGDGAAEFEVPSLAAGASHDELFVLPTERRGVVPVGPATSVRGDPLGLLRRAVPWTEPIPLFVHPRTAPLGHLGAGFLRDLEGQPTTDLSPSDIAFHALRDYQPGDDRRFVHWMTTARVGKLMVRQFTDTRRAHLAVVLDGARSAYVDEDADVCDEFELAVSIAGSLGVRAISDQQEVSIIAGGHILPCVNGPTMLDGLAGVELGGRRSGLAEEVDRLTRNVAGVSLAIVVTGSRTGIAELRAATSRFSPDVRTIAIRVDPGAGTGFRPVGSTVVLTVSSLEELGHLMWAVTQS